MNAYEGEALTMSLSDAEELGVEALLDLVEAGRAVTLENPGGEPVAVVPAERVMRVRGLARAEEEIRQLLAGVLGEDALRGGEEGEGVRQGA
ncbi:hypothetical protein ACP4TB_24735 [Streptomyces sp. DR3-1]|uniref:hypothetical protein n=1 Tax=Streptomyces sp. DR3-1 TaxID=2951169 RepID=UPI002042E49C|nr:hypothetical protein [Streptomyces sp. DR3-1]MCM3821483.1 hypothetical protein [Streptomyces sp. DR3-1]